MEIQNPEDFLMLQVDPQINKARFSQLEEMIYQASQYAIQRVRDLESQGSTCPAAMTICVIGNTVRLEEPSVSFGGTVGSTINVGKTTGDRRVDHCCAVDYDYEAVRHLLKLGMYHPDAISQITDVEQDAVVRVAIDMAKNGEL